LVRALRGGRPRSCQASSVRVWGGLARHKRAQCLGEVVSTMKKPALSLLGLALLLSGCTLLSIDEIRPAVGVVVYSEGFSPEAAEQPSGLRKRSTTSKSSCPSSSSSRVTTAARSSMTSASTWISPTPKGRPVTSPASLSATRDPTTSIWPRSRTGGAHPSQEVQRRLAEAGHRRALGGSGPRHREGSPPQHNPADGAVWPTEPREEASLRHPKTGRAAAAWKSGARLQDQAWHQAGEADLPESRTVAKGKGGARLLPPVGCTELLVGVGIDCGRVQYRRMALSAVLPQIGLCAHR